MDARGVSPIGYKIDLFYGEMDSGNADDVPEAAKGRSSR
jgi:hypothetical protein